MSRYEIRLTGSGGQGMITAGIILAHAASINEGRNAVQSQSYGPEARGGASKAEVIISDDEINYPKVVAPDMLVALTQEAFDKYCEGVNPDAIVIVDNTMVTKVKKVGGKFYSLPIISSVQDALGSELSANVATIALANALGGFVKDESLLKSVLSMVPKGTEDANKKAFDIGTRLAANAR